MHCRIGAGRVGEKVLARHANQFVPGAAGKRHHLFVDVGNDALRIRHHQRVDVRFDQRACVKLLVAQTMIQQGLGGFLLLTRGVIGADQQISDDGFCAVAQRGHRHHCREAAAILANIGQLIDIFYPARGLEYQCLDARCDRCIELKTQDGCARDQLCRGGDIGRCDSVDHVFGQITEHAFGADVEDLDDAFFIGSDTEK